jgi:hypothetical protein
MPSRSLPRIVATSVTRRRRSSQLSDKIEGIKLLPPCHVKGIIAIAAHSQGAPQSDLSMPTC